MNLFISCVPFGIIPTMFSAKNLASITLGIDLFNVVITTRPPFLVNFDKSEMNCFLLSTCSITSEAITKSNFRSLNLFMKFDVEIHW